MSRARSADELRDEFLDAVRNYVDYWHNVRDVDDRERIEGVAFSILCLIDGVSNGPALDLVARPHPSDKEYHIDNDENWIEDGTVINGSDYLHEILHINKEEK